MALANENLQVCSHDHMQCQSVILTVDVRVSAMETTSADYDIPCHSTALIMLGEEQTYKFTHFLVMFDIFVILE